MDDEVNKSMTAAVESDAPRALGRPRDPAKYEAILSASWRLYLAHGVAPVTVDVIAAEAGVSKATVYSYFPDKRALFQEGVRREMAAIETAQQRLETESNLADLRGVLIAFGNGIMSFLTSASAIDFYASLSGELRRDHELARMFYEAGPGKTLSNLAAILSGPLAARFKIADPRDAAEMLLGMWQGMTNYRLMLGVDHDDGISSIENRVERGVERFLSAYAK